MTTGLPSGYGNGNGNGDRDFMRWLSNLIKAVSYIAVIVSATLFVSKWDKRMDKLEDGMARIESQVTRLATDTIQRAEYERVKREANRQHRRLWAAIGRKQDAEDLGE